MDILYHLYADDTHLWIVVDPIDLDNTICQMEMCVTSVKLWMEKHQLRINDDWVPFDIPKVSHTSQWSTIASHWRSWNHPIILCSELWCCHGLQGLHGIPHAVCKQSCYVHIHNISKIKKFLDQSSLECVVHAFITTKLDYCNSLLCGAPTSLTHKLRWIQNTAARIITGSGSREHITPILKSLHWLPVQHTRGSNLILSSWSTRLLTTKPHYICKICFIAMYHCEDCTLVTRTYWLYHSQDHLWFKTVLLVWQGPISGIVSHSVWELHPVYQYLRPNSKLIYS